MRGVSHGIDKQISNNVCCVAVIFEFLILYFSMLNALLFNHLGLILISYISSVRVSNELGLGHPRAAKYSVYVTVFQSLLIGLLFMVIILITKDYFAIIFTSSAELQRAVAKLAFLLGITMVLNSVQPVISGLNSNFSTKLITFLFCSFPSC